MMDPTLNLRRVLSNQPPVSESASIARPHMSLTWLNIDRHVAQHRSSRSIFNGPPKSTTKKQDSPLDDSNSEADFEITYRIQQLSHTTTKSLDLLSRTGYEEWRAQVGQRVNLSAGSKFVIGWKFQGAPKNEAYDGIDEAEEYKRMVRKVTTLHEACLKDRRKKMKEVLLEIEVCFKLCFAILM